MRLVVRNLLFSFLALYCLSRFFTGFIIKGNYLSTSFLLSLGFALVNTLAKPLLRIMSLPSSGVGYLILNSIVSIISFFVFDRVLDRASIQIGSLINLNVFGIMLSSYELTVFWGYVLAGVWFSFVMWFHNWLYGVKKNK